MSNQSAIDLHNSLLNAQNNNTCALSNMCEKPRVEQILSRL